MSMKEEEDREFDLAPYTGTRPWWELLEPAHASELFRAERVVQLEKGELRPLIERARMAMGSAAEVAGTLHSMVKVPIDSRRSIGFETSRGALRFGTLIRRRSPGDAWKEGGG